MREGDRLLVAGAENWAEPIVTGVVDGFARRPRSTSERGPRLELQRDQSLLLTTAEGEPLVELRQGPDGPVVRLLDRGVALELPGKLSLTADSISLRAVRGGIEMDASDDIALRGELIHLN